MGASLDLDLDIAAADFIGRKARPVTAEVIRELTASDIALLGTERGIKPSHIARLSERHHALARCLASGLSVSDACAITGYTPSRVSILKGDPSFEELIAFYRGPAAELVQDLGAKMRQNALEAQNILTERLEEEPASFDAGTLLDITKLGADRTGFGPASRTTSVHVHMNLADRLKTARQRTQVIEGTVSHATPGEHPGKPPTEDPSE
jgi:hypothetical protein